MEVVTVSRRKPLVPEAKAALDRIKTEYANELGVKLNNEYKYKGDIPSNLNGFVGGPIGGAMVRDMVAAYEKKLIDK
jgi:hypothetical protein